MTRPTDHYDPADIIKRLEAAYGPDRELDFVVALTLGFTKSEVDPIGEAPTVEVWISPDRVCSYERLPEFTASLDAAIALVERVLGDRLLQRDMADGLSGPYARLVVFFGDGLDHEEFMVSGVASEPIALLIALFKALEAKDG